MTQPPALLVELCYLPPVQHLAHALAAGELVLEACETYQKGGWRNRCEIAGPNGPLRLTVPLVKGKHQQQPIREVEIAYDEDWPRRHWQSIRTAYGSAPFFPYYAEELHALLENRPARLWLLNRSLLDFLLRALQLSIKVSETTVYTKETPEDVLDLRGRVRPGAIAKDAGFEPAPYAQLFTEKHGFLPNLSTLDLLFCAGPQARQYLRASIVETKPSCH